MTLGEGETLHLVRGDTETFIEADTGPRFTVGPIVNHSGVAAYVRLVR